MLLKLASITSKIGWSRTVLMDKIASGLPGERGGVMKVTNNGVSQTTRTSSQPAADASGVARDVQVDVPAQPKDAYTPSAEWLRLVELVKQVPEIREDRIHEVSQRLQRGDYLSPDSAAKTADAMVRALD